MPGEIFMNSLAVDIEKLHTYILLNMQDFRGRETGEEILVKELGQKGKAISRSVHN